MVNAVYAMAVAVFILAMVWRSKKVAAAKLAVELAVEQLRLEAAKEDPRLLFLKVRNAQICSRNVLGHLWAVKGLELALWKDEEVLTLTRKIDPS